MGMPSISHLRQPLNPARTQKDGVDDVGQGYISRLMRMMNRRAIYCRPRTNIPNPGHEVYPYLLQCLGITRANHVWCADITYLPMARGFACLIAVMNWTSRKLLFFRLSNTLRTSFCLEALREVIARCGSPLFNNDQGSLFNSEEFTDILKDHDISISMDGCVRLTDNIFIGWLRRSVKYEEVYLKASESLSEARRGLGEYCELYNKKRPHQFLGYNTPDYVCWNTLPKMPVAV